MNSFWRATWILFGAHLRRTFLSRRGLVAAGLGLLPVLAGLLITTVTRIKGEAPPLTVVMHLGWFLEVQTIVPLVALVMSSAVVAEEIEDRTITYLFTRPVPRASILIGRWLAALTVVLVFLGLSSAVVVRLLSGLGGPGHAMLPQGFGLRLVQTVLLGGLVYSALFAALGALFKRPILIGLGYTFVFEGFLGNLPGSNQKLTVLYYLKSFLLSGQDELLPHFAETLAFVQLAEPGAALATLAEITLVALVLGAWRLSRREYVLSA